MRLSLKLSISRTRDDGSTFRVKMQDQVGEWWLMNACEWSDRHSDGFVFSDRQIAERAVDLLQQADDRYGWRAPRQFSIVQFKKGA